MANTTSKLSSIALQQHGIPAFHVHDLLNPKLLGTLLITHLILVRSLRYIFLKRNNATIPPGAPLSSMTIPQAQTIVLRIAQQEFPFFYKAALSFALFRTYGIPSISQLLVATRLFAEPDSASKRYVDTQALIIEFILRDVGSRPWTEGLARTVCIHAKYRASGRIRDEDMLYTLALFVREPVRFIKQYEWRELSDVEICAVGVFWKMIADAMGIEMRGLKTFDEGGRWRDGLHWYKELCGWAERYEERCMVPDKANEKLAAQTTRILLWTVPEKRKGVGRQIVSAMMDERLRRAMSVPPPPKLVHGFVHGFIQLRRFCIRHFALPKPWIFRYHNSTDEPSPEGTYNMFYYDSMPYYVKPGFWNRYGPSAWKRRIQGLPVPGDEGSKYYPGGYKTVDVGPNHGKLGQKETEKEVEVFGQMKCPLAFE